MMKAFVSISLLFLSVFAASAVVIPYPSIDDPLAFVKSIELAEPKYKPRSNSTLRGSDTPPDNKKEGYVVGGAVSAFTDKLKGIDKQDVLDATLFAQLAADKGYDREKDTVNWYKYYKYVLGNIGFVAQSFNFQLYKASGSEFSMDQVVIEILAAIATGGQSIVISETLNALRGLSKSDNRIELFSQRSSTSSSGNFQVYPVDVSENGDVSMALGTFYFNSNAHHVNVLFFSWSSSSIQVYKGAQRVVLNRSVYSKVRSTVSSKLGDNAVNLVASIEL